MNPPPANCQLAIQAKSLFNTTVASIISPTNMCGNAGCHGGQGTPQIQFITATNLYQSVTSYPQLVGNFDKTTAPIITQIVPGPHFATYTPTQVTTIGTWLDAEVQARSMCATVPTSTTPSPGQIEAQLISEWSGCMNLGDWNSSTVAVSIAGLTSSQGPCIRCHVNAAYNMVATDQSQRAFDLLTTTTDFLTVYFTPDLSNMAAPKMIVNTALFTKVGTAQTPFIEHPLFDPNAQAFDNLKQFYDKTMAHKTAGTCSPSRLITPP
jgi:hypothetical protein